MYWADVAFSDGQWGVYCTDGFHPIRMNGRPAQPFVAGWRARGVYCGIEKYYILDLARDSGEFAFWLLDSDFNFVSNQMNDLTPEVRNSFRSAVQKCLNSVAMDLLKNGRPALEMRCEAFFSLNQELRSQLLHLKPHSDFAEPQIIDLATCSTSSWDVGEVDEKGICLDRAGILRAVRAKVSDQFLAAFSEKRLRWPSLSDNELCSDARCFFFSEVFGVIRCVDPNSALVYFVALCGSPLTSVAVFIPALGYIFTSTEYMGAAFKVYVTSGNLVYSILDHMLAAPSAFLNWLELEPTKFATFMWPESGALIGHYLWNELSGLEAIVDGVAPENYPQIFGLGAAAGIEFYGPVEDVFPEFNGLVVRSHSQVREMQNYCYENRIHTLLISMSYVSGRLRNRVMSVVNSDPAVRMISTLLTAESASNAIHGTIPTIVLGLRVGNRTHVDLGSFYCQIIERLLSVVTRLTIVIDGHNSQPGRRMGIPFRSAIGGPAMDKENEIVNQIGNCFAGRPVTIVNCVGSTMLVNLFWINRASLFVAPWGAGLAKYRWVCNKAGFVFSSRINLLFSQGLEIYHSSNCMEDPAPIEFIDPKNVIDLPKYPREFAEARDVEAGRGLHHHSTVCFDILSLPVLDDITELFQKSIQ